MSIAQFAIPGVWAPFQDLWHWFMQSPARDRSAALCMDQLPPPEQAAVSIRRPLRIVRVLEAGQAPANVGRMVISGRMADVCAELDRLAAREAALH